MHISILRNWKRSFIGLSHAVFGPGSKKIRIPAVDKAYTISQGYADLFQKHYHKTFQVVRNVARLRDQAQSKTKRPLFYTKAPSITEGV